MNKRKILNILFWILLLIGVALVLWRILGNSPSDFSIILTFTLMLMFKILSVSDELKDFKHDVKTSFNKIKEDDMDEIKDILNKNRK